MRNNLLQLRRGWHPSTLGQECTLHQLSPYVGKLKSSIARALVKRYSRHGDTIFDPFSGSGAIPLEGLLLGRNVVANDINPYAGVLTQAKMFPPDALADAITRAR